MLEYSLQSFIRLKIDFTSVNIDGLKDTFIKVKERLQAWQLSSALSNTETLPKTWSVNAVFVLVMGYFACFWQYRNIRMWSWGSMLINFYILTVAAWGVQSPRPASLRFPLQQTWSHSGEAGKSFSDPEHSNLQFYFVVNTSPEDDSVSVSVPDKRLENRSCVLVILYSFSLKMPRYTWVFRFSRVLIIWFIHI